MKLAIVGSRDFNDYYFFHKKLIEKIDISTIDLIVSGGAIGVDSMGSFFADKNNIPTMIIKPDWTKFGKAAGFIRNEEIVNNADIVIAFIKNKSRGTMNSINHAKRKNKILFIIEVE